MAWAALVPIALQLLDSSSKSQQPAPGPQLPPPPSLGQIFSANDQKYAQSPTFGAPQSNPFSPIPVGSGSRGFNG